MKKLFLILSLLITSSFLFAQKGKPSGSVDTIVLERSGNTVNFYQYINDIKTFRGYVNEGGLNSSLSYDSIYGSYYSIASGRNRTGNGRWNLVIGEGAGDHITNDANYNTLLGAHAGNAITTGDDNVFMGWDAGLFTTSGRGNVGFPQDALKYNTTGSDNIAIGKFSQYTNTSGQGNVGVGFNTMYYLKKGDGNVAIGKYAGGIFGEGYGNVFIGEYAGETNNDAAIVNQSIAIGQYTGLSRMYSKNILIGYNIQPTAPNQINIGNVYKGDVSTGMAEVNSISISGNQLTFDSDYMYVKNISTGITKRVPLQDISAASLTKAVVVPSTQRVAIYNTKGQLVGWATFQLNQ